jgi:hypothetical protein
MAVADIILQQLGGNRFLAMTGAKNLVGTEDSLLFRLPRNEKRINHVRVRLTPADTYTVTFWNIGRGRDLSMEIIEEAENIYADNLQSLFTSATGLETHL